MVKLSTRCKEKIKNCLTHLSKVKIILQTSFVATDCRGLLPERLKKIKDTKIGNIITVADIGSQFMINSIHKHIHKYR